MTRAVLALGANLGNPREAICGAMDALDACDGVTVIARSSLYRTAPVGGPEQPDFLNAVVVVETTLDPHALLACGQAVEQQWHRTREVRWGPRTLDVDVIIIDGVVSDDAVLTLPHPRARERAFVLVPWLEADPGATLEGMSVSDLIAELDTSDIERLDAA